MQEPNTGLAFSTMPDGSTNERPRRPVMMGYGYDGGGGWMWGFGGLLMLGVLVLIGLAVWAVLTASHRPQHSGTGREGPVAGTSGGADRTRQVLDERYARGEMTTDDYTDRLHTLGL